LRVVKLQRDILPTVAQRVFKRALQK